MMDEQLAGVIENLNRRGVDYVLDSGTLLGLIRDGRLLAADHDLDISLPFGEIEKMNSSIESMGIDEETISIQTVRGDIFKIFVSAYYSEEEGARSIDFKFFKCDGDRYISPQAYRQKNPFPYQKWSYSFYEIARKFFLYLKREYTKNNLHLPMDRFPFNYVHQFKTWDIPACFFEEPQEITIDGLVVKIPADVEDYLQLRYGDWKTEKKNWNYWLDDGGLKDADPFERWAENG